MVDAVLGRQLRQRLFATDRLERQFGLELRGIPLLFPVIGFVLSSGRTKLADCPGFGDHFRGSVGLWLEVALPIAYQRFVLRTELISGLSSCRLYRHEKDAWIMTGRAVTGPLNDLKASLLDLSL